MIHKKAELLWIPRQQRLMQSPTQVSERSPPKGNREAWNQISRAAGVENLRIKSTLSSSNFLYHLLQNIKSNFFLKLFLAKFCLFLMEISVAGDAEIAELGCQICKVVPGRGSASRAVLSWKLPNALSSPLPLPMLSRVKAVLEIVRPI